MAPLPIRPTALARSPHATVNNRYRHHHHHHSRYRRHGCGTSTVALQLDIGATSSETVGSTACPSLPARDPMRSGVLRVEPRHVEACLGNASLRKAGSRLTFSSGAILTQIPRVNPCMAAPVESAVSAVPRSREAARRRQVSVTALRQSEEETASPSLPPNRLQPHMQKQQQSSAFPSTPPSTSSQFDAAATSTLKPTPPPLSAPSITSSSTGSSGDSSSSNGGGGRSGWWSVAWWLFLSGAFLGPPLDGLHSVTGLQVYDGPGAIVIGDEPYALYTNLWVSPLLGAMYAVIGMLQLFLDTAFAPSTPPSPPTSTAPSSPSPQTKPLLAVSDSSPSKREPFSLFQPAPEGSPLKVVACVGVLIELLRFSALMYEAEVDPRIILAVLAATAHGNWFVFDRTLAGYLLAWLVAVAAPLSEVVIIKYFGLWHYSTPDIFVAEEGLVSWTTCCYFFYTQWVATVARALRSILVSTASDAKAA